MIPKDINFLTKEDLQSLKSNSISESKTMDYKKQLSLQNDAEKKEFLADIVSFANTSGGDIIYGILEKKGIPVSFDGIEIEDVDQLKQKIENLLRDCIEPRISSIMMREVANGDNNYFFIIRIPKSWASPHRLNIKDSKRFYARNSNGKYELDIVELRRAFLLSDAYSTNLKSFRQERISKIIASETPVSLDNNAKIVLHLIPIISLNQNQNYDITTIKNNLDYNKPLGSGGWNTSYNFEGLVSYNGNINVHTSSYTQFYKNGIIEAVSSEIIYMGDDKIQKFPNPEFEKVMFSGLRQYLSLYDNIGVDYPVFVVVTLLNYKGVYFTRDYYRKSYDNKFFDRDILLIPEALVERTKLNYHAILRPIFDCVWNTVGYERCLNYDEKGLYNPD